MTDSDGNSVGLKVAIREAAIAALEQRGFRVVNRATGAGSPPFSQIDLIKGSETLRCAMKLTMRPQGRIHFAREGDEWKVLRHARLVLHVWHHPGEPDVLRITMFKAETIGDAFNENYKAAVAGGFDHIPAWLSPKREPGARFIGSGFEDAAEWTETIPFSSKRVAPTAHTSSKPPQVVGGGDSIMSRIKAMLAEHMGVPAERIEVDVRVKL